MKDIRDEIEEAGLPVIRRCPLHPTGNHEPFECPPESEPDDNMVTLNDLLEGKGR